MKIKSLLAKPFAGYIYKQIKKGMETAVADQQTIFNQLIKVGTKTISLLLFPLITADVILYLSASITVIKLLKSSLR